MKANVKVEHATTLQTEVFHKGNIVTSDEFIILVTSDHNDEDCFSGARIDIMGIGVHSKIWMKSEFKQFKGTITITT